MKLTLAIGLAIAGVSIWFLNPIVWLLTLPLAFVAFAYTVPIVRINASVIRIREIGLWKIFLIAAVWTGMTVILPAMEHKGLAQISDPLTWHLALERTLFIFAITIPFDVRDLVNDQKKDIRTIPSAMGWKRSVVLTELIMILFISLVVFRLGVHHPFFLGYAISTVISMIIVALSNPNRNDMYCSFWVEGTMVLQFGCILAFLKQLY